jgi:hypothetical protein
MTTEKKPDWVKDKETPMQRTTFLVTRLRRDLRWLYDKLGPERIRVATEEAEAMGVDLERVFEKAPIEDLTLYDFVVAYNVAGHLVSVKHAEFLNRG